MGPTATRCPESEAIKGAWVLYDGDCGFCAGWVRFVLKHDPAEYFFFGSLQGFGAKILRDHGEPSSALDTLVLYEGGRFFRKSDAVVRIMSRLSWPWRVGRLLGWCPPGIRDCAYDLVARMRHSMPSRSQCEIIPASVRHRFLDEKVGVAPRVAQSSEPE